jgi:hypothetical protein
LHGFLGGTAGRCSGTNRRGHHPRHPGVYGVGYMALAGDGLESLVRFVARDGKDFIEQRNPLARI